MSSIKYKNLEKLRHAIGKRLREFRMNNLLNQKQMARGLDVDQGELSRWEKGKTLMGTKYLCLLAIEYHLSIDWLFTGEGDMFRTKIAKLLTDRVAERAMRQYLAGLNGVSVADLREERFRELLREELAKYGLTPKEE